MIVQRALRPKIVWWLEQKYFRRDWTRAEEAWNDALYRIWTRIEEYDASRARFVTWVWNQARWAALDLVRHHRAESREVPFAGEEVEGTATGDGDAIADLLLRALEAESERVSTPAPLPGGEEAAIRRAFRRLSVTEQRLLWLHYVLGVPHVEIARRGLLEPPLPEEHLRVYVNRAAKRLHRFYEEELARGEGEGGE
jgi:RNA polymerase sigma factor (sigma-70 family)